MVGSSITMIKKIASLYAERLLSDITLIVGEKEFPAHRLILCASSDVFQVMLMSPIWQESQESRITLREDPHCCVVFPEFLKYLYTGKIEISCNSVLSVLMLGDKYNVKDLVKLSLRYMSNHIVTASHSSQLVSWYQYTLSFGHNDIAKACSDFILWNFDMVAQANDFVNFETDLLISFLNSNELSVFDEFTLFHAAAKWLNNLSQRLCIEIDGSLGEVEEELEMSDVQRELLKPYVHAVMRHIRFPMMTPRQLADLLLFPLIRQYKDFFVDRMAVGMSFHSGELSSWHQANDPCQFLARLYTTERWSASLTVDNFSSLPMYVCRTLVFQSLVSASDLYSDCSKEWIVEAFPKGVMFNRFYLIAWQAMMEVPEAVLKTVRLSITPKEANEERVKVGVLLYSAQDGIEHVKLVVTKNYVFKDSERILNFDNLLSFSELNGPKMLKTYMVGPTSDILKIKIVIIPLSDPALTLNNT